jgi:hypothetical protein
MRAQSAEFATTQMTAHPIVGIANTWTPSDWIALAGVFATICGVIATLAGVRLGAQIAQRDTRRRDAETALVAVELAYRALNVEDLSTEDLIDDSHGIDNSTARMTRIISADSARLAHEAITSLITRRNEASITRVARELDARLDAAQQLVASWYACQIGVRKVSHTSKGLALTAATQSLTAARLALDELRLKIDELRELTLGE